VADAEPGERPNDDRGANGTATSMNTRFSATDRNEIMVMRFDLTGINVAAATSATLNLTHHRNNTSVRPYIVYGVKDGAVGGDNNTPTTPAQGYDDNTWDENVVRMSTMPGLIYDGDTVNTQGINATDTVNLGGGNFINALKGDVDTLSAAGLLAFLQAHPDNLVTLIVARDPSNLSTGQDRFATKEATSLDGGTPTGNAGDFAPYLEFDIVPEPTAGSLAMIGLVLFAMRRRGR
jgi:hypothetical protein